jgi:hypothetical protein
VKTFSSLKPQSPLFSGGKNKIHPLADLVENDFEVKSDGIAQNDSDIENGIVTQKIDLHM